MSGAAGLALAMFSAPALADHHNEGGQAMNEEMADSMDAYEMTTMQQTDYDSWNATQQSTYDNWPGGVQEYYFTLNDDQQDAWWMLNDEQRVQVYNLGETQRTAAWTSIMNQVNARQSGMSGMNNSSQTGMNNASPTGMNNSSSTAMMSNMGNSGNIRFVRNEEVQAAPAPHNGEYPICNSDMDDNCMNPWEAGKRGPGVEQPLSYWPGRPASEIDEPLPATRPN
ncbi:hypothetical protein GRI38_05740 [Altererythrobacter aurantiacus]|uniref:Uncharacterized protein n=1 Tax=Parapontixanthobacter aurantiacus TaxID=1463599 RepID=A0A844ZCM1_9SPHN|nr:hypothetical protein [Parapontixanthobacter aurantiacus]MXO85528.1 hypothetical protein [Parapontixanthobacter aurantiacus]